MAKNPVNDNGLSNNVHDKIELWFNCEYRINEAQKLEAQCIKDIKNEAQKLEAQCIKDIKNEIKSAREQGYTEEEIKECIGNITIPVKTLLSFFEDDK